jgi:hypothetical protein
MNFLSTLKREGDNNLVSKVLRMQGWEKQSHHQTYLMGSTMGLRKCYSKKYTTLIMYRAALYTTLVLTFAATKNTVGISLYLEDGPFLNL